jgi:hypothetical protein
MNAAGTLLILSLSLVVVSGSQGAQSGGAYILDLSTIDGGGGQSSGGQYTLTGTIGQPDAAYSEGGSYELLGGFWPGGPLCIVDFEQFSIFAEYWLETGSGLLGDLNGNGYVDIDDLKFFVDEWLCVCPYNWPLTGRPLCIVDFPDFAFFAQYWLQSGAGLPADLNGNGYVDIDDLEFFVDDWLRPCPYNWPLK